MQFVVLRGSFELNCIRFSAVSEPGVELFYWRAGGLSWDYPYLLDAPQGPEKLFVSEP